MADRTHHIISLSFDDGFLRSCQRIAKAYERFGLSACFNVTATGSMGGDQYDAVPKGDWAFWNEMVARGHEVMPHGYDHSNKAGIPFEQAKGLIERCLGVFDEKLVSFRRKSAVFNFPFNRTTPELEAWLPSVVRAFRGGCGDGPRTGINPLPSPRTTAIRTTGFGPGRCEDHLDQHVDLLLGGPPAWLVYNLHGLDDEGWGPIRAEYLQRLLERLVKVPSITILPVGRALPMRENR